MTQDIVWNPHFDKRAVEGSCRSLREDAEVYRVWGFGGRLSLRKHGTVPNLQEHPESSQRHAQDRRERQQKGPDERAPR